MRSFVDAANRADCDFPLANLPCGVFSTDGDGARCGVAIGDRVLDLRKAEAEGLTGTAGTFAAPSWNAHMAAGRDAWAALRTRLTAMLAQDSDRRGEIEPLLVPLESVALHMPFAVGEFTDFYAGRNHAANIGEILRGAQNALPPNWEHMPIAYNGRASTVVVSGTPVRRPFGQVKSPDAQGPHLTASERLDFELELGAVVGLPSAMGERVDAGAAGAMIFGYVLLNDWSARDVQAWEYQPLGPFQSKAFATSISSWIVTAAALEPAMAWPVDPATGLLPHLRETTPGALDLDLSVTLTPSGGEANEIARTNARQLAYTAAQQLAHHSTCGCAMRTGDLLGSGTISGPQPGSYGSMMELGWAGSRPLTLADGSRRAFLHDGDTITLRGHATTDGGRIGFGQCSGTILPAQ